MIVVDSSVLVAIVLGEPGAEFLRIRLSSESIALVSTAGFLEASMVVAGRQGVAAMADLDRLILDAGIALVAFDVRQAAFARAAFLRYGKGRHAAALNFGDCMAYALAKSLDVPLLHKGADFAATDLKPI